MSDVGAGTGGKGGKVDKGFVSLVFFVGLTAGCVMLISAKMNVMKLV